jgi:uncharacterized protein
MWIKTRNSIVVITFTLFFSSFLLISCGNSTNVEIKKVDSSQQEIDIQFKKAEDLFDQDKSEEAYKILKKLADEGDAKSQNALGNGYEYGFWGDVNLEQAKYWYTKAASQNYIKGIHNLGVILFLQNHHKEALPYFEKGKSLNHADSINMLGIYYSKGIIVEQDYKKALEYFDKALDIDKNNASAQFNVGQAYYYGEGVEKDYKKAFTWYVKSSNQDYSLATIQLAQIYFNGLGLPKDKAKAIEIIKPLAELGDQKAQENLKWYIDHPD